MSNQFKPHLLPLYKFISLDSFQKTLAEWAVKVSLRHDVNDPLENVPRSEVGKDQQLHIDIPPFFSFSRNISIPAMWGHYADDAKGVCMVFLFPITPTSFCEVKGADVAHITLDETTRDAGCLQDSIFLKLNYTNERADAENIESDTTECRTTNWAHELMKRKAKCWGYEDEIRLLVNINHASKVVGKHFLYSWPMQFFIGAVAGPKCAMLPSMLKRQIDYYYQEQLKREGAKTNYLHTHTYIRDWIVESARFHPTRFEIRGDFFEDKMLNFDFWQKFTKFQKKH